MKFLVAFAALLAAGLLSAQSIQVYSEFRRVDANGEIVPADQGGTPREILSPLLARNSHATFRVVVEVPQGQHYYLYVGTNPEKIFEITIYKEMWQKKDGTTIPDRLLRITDDPYLSHVPDRYHGLSSQTAESFLVDVFVPPDVEPERAKLEPQVNVNGIWALYPMEVRISTKVVPDHGLKNARLPGIEEPADRSVLGPLRQYLCAIPERGRNGHESVRQIIRRNAIEDMALARKLEKELGTDAVATGLLSGLGIDRPTFCAARGEDLKSPLGPEWYLRGRDFLYKSDLPW